jgi:hypothetical protein
MFVNLNKLLLDVLNETSGEVISKATMIDLFSG